MTPTPDVLSSPAVSLLVGLEADGFTFAISGDRLLVRPVERLTPEQKDVLRRERETLVTLLRCCDAGVVERREAFTIQLRASRAIVPALLFREGIPYAAGRCFSCADPLEGSRYGRCWRCSLAWRLTLGVAIPADFAAAYDAKEVA